MNVVFRTDSSQAMGSGHVMRCLTLAGALREADSTVSFICREQPGNLCDRIESQGFSVDRLTSSAAGFSPDASPAHAAWLGATWQEDVEQTRAALRNRGATPDWLIVDHYAIEQRWERALRGAVGRLLVVDDLADRDHDCDVLLDQNLVAGLRSRYTDRVPATCSLLLGPRYALLQPIYAQLRNETAPRTGPIRRILISFGAADQGNLTRRALAGALSLHRPDIEFDVVIADSSPHAGIVRELAGLHSNVRVHGWLPTLAPLIAQSDLAIGAGGATSWERLCLGLPALVVIMAENQRPIAEELQRRGLVTVLGAAPEVSEVTFAAALAEALGKRRPADGTLQAADTGIDARGTDRVRAVLTVGRGSPLQARSAEPADESLLLEWANDPTTRRNSFDSKQIDPEAHRQWFRSRLQNPAECSFYIVTTADDVAVGQVRFQQDGSAWEIHYSLAPAFRGRGIGCSLLECALRKLTSERHGTQILGHVRNDNIPSRRLFESLGFGVAAGTTADSVVYQRSFEL